MRAPRSLLVGLVLLGAFACGSRRGALDASKDETTPIGSPDFGDARAPDAPLTQGDPTTCQEAAATRSYIGCDYWPTITPNSVWSVFDFAVVVSNAGVAPADVTVTGPNGVDQTVTVEPKELAKIYLPWVPELKGEDANECGAPQKFATSLVQKDGAYHLISTRPVSVYQFSALEYKPSGGPPGKDWSSCPASKCMVPNPCFSYSNDASLLPPSTAMTGNYRILGHGGGGGQYIVVTATENGTQVSTAVAAKGNVLAGNGVPAAGPGAITTVSLDAGDVAVLAASVQNDLSGSLVTANKPVQVVSGNSIMWLPTDDDAAGDHIEETMLPAEALGKHYVLSTPTGPNGVAVAHLVRLVGNANGTNLVYKPSKPSGCPLTLNAGELVDCGVVDGSFEVTGDHEFAAGMFLLGQSVIDPNNLRGDPSQSSAVPVEQWRSSYVFLAPDDYDVSFADILEEKGTTLTIDGVDPGGDITPIGAYEVRRVKLTSGNAGAHKLEATKPVGLQVLGYGLYTSYQYPGGLDLHPIAPPPTTTK